MLTVALERSETMWIIVPVITGGLGEGKLNCGITPNSLMHLTQQTAE